MSDSRLDYKRHCGFLLAFSPESLSLGIQLSCCKDTQAPTWREPFGAELN